jgi:hypothetical protein
VTEESETVTRPGHNSWQKVFPREDGKGFWHTIQTLVWTILECSVNKFTNYSVSEVEASIFMGISVKGCVYGP